MLEALLHYRKNYLKLSPLPALNKKTPLIPHLKNPYKPISHDGPIRQFVQKCFDEVAELLELESKQEESNGLRIATVHWLRHTGISEDVKRRPRRACSG